MSKGNFEKAIDKIIADRKAQTPNYHDDTAVCPYCCAKIRGTYDRPCRSCREIENQEARGGY